jgi:alkanesulfonate monooxygenase
MGQFVADNSERIKPIIAHRPGFQFPTQVAKAFAGLDRISGGRVGIHIITGGSDLEQRREGDYTTKEERYRRSEEFIEILRRVWTEDGPVSHEGEFYRFEDFQTDVRPIQDAIPVSVGGSSQQAYEVGGRQGDIFGLWGEPLAETREQIAAVNAVADAAGRPRPRIWNSFRPIVAPTDELAWEKAQGVLAKTKADYAEIGCDLLSIRGWDVYNDAQDYVRHVLPLVRQELAHRDATGNAPVLNPDSRPQAALVGV